MDTNSTIQTLENMRNTRGDAKMGEKDSQENRTICRLLKLHLDEFYSDIYIDYADFRNNKWKINKVLYDSEHVLFYIKRFLTEEDDTKFYEVFEKYTEMIEEIMNPNNKLSHFLKRWTDMTGSVWLDKNINSYLKSLITHKKYQYISPEYTTNIYYTLCKKYSNNIELVKVDIEEHLNGIVSNVRSEIKEFKSVYNEIIASYTYEFPIDSTEQYTYTLGFINSIILSILIFAEKMIELHVYAVHPIINGVIEYYTPLDEISEYSPSENGNRQIYVV